MGERSLRDPGAIASKTGSEFGRPKISRYQLFSAALMLELHSNKSQQLQGFVVHMSRPCYNLRQLRLKTD